MIFKKFTNSRSSPSNFKSFSRSREQFFSHSKSDQFWKQNTISECAIEISNLELEISKVLARPKQSKVSTKHEVAVKSCKKEIDDNKVMRVFSASVYTQCGIEK